MTINSEIASIIYEELEYDGDDFSSHLADVLVRKLGISRHTITCSDGTRITRFVTLWRADDG